MKQISIVFLKTAIVFIGISVLAVMIRFPQTEGRAVNLDLISIYTDPFIIYMYIASIPFFVALFQVFILLGHVENNKILHVVKTIRNIKYCALAIIGFVIGAIFFIRFMAHGEDAAGPTMIGFITIFISLVVVAISNILERTLRSTKNIKLKMPLRPAKQGYVRH